MHEKKNIDWQAKGRRAALFPSEAKLWTRLSGNQLGAHFRKQAVTDGYISDFYVASLNLIVDIVPATKQRREWALVEHKRLERIGYTVLCFTVKEVMNETGRVVRVIQEAVANLLRDKAEGKIKRIDRRNTIASPVSEERFDGGPRKKLNDYGNEEWVCRRKAATLEFNIRCPDVSPKDLDRHLPFAFTVECESEEVAIQRMEDSFSKVPQKAWATRYKLMDESKPVV